MSRRLYSNGHVRKFSLLKVQHRLLERCLQLLQETEHFCRWRQEKVAKIVPYALPKI